MKITTKMTDESKTRLKALLTTLEHKIHRFIIDKQAMPDHATRHTRQLKGVDGIMDVSKEILEASEGLPTFQAPLRKLLAALGLGADIDVKAEAARLLLGDEEESAVAGA